MAICTVNYAEMYARVDERRLAKELSWRRVAVEIGVPPGTFIRLRRGMGMSDDTLVSIMHWLGTADSIRPFLVVDGEPLDTSEA